MAVDVDYLVDRELATQLEQWQAAVLRGDATDWANYMYLCGQIYGIRFAMQVLAEARQKAIAAEGFE